jgi:hypothetical protein
LITSIVSPFIDLHHVAGSLCPPVGHVFHQPDQTHDIRLGLPQRQRPHDARDDTRAAHVHRHVFHAAGRLDRDAAGVEHHPLADQRKGAAPFRRRAIA